jgi:hypothetical protein
MGNRFSVQVLPAWTETSDQVRGLNSGRPGLDRPRVGRRLGNCAGLTRLSERAIVSASRVSSTPGEESQLPQHRVSRFRDMPLADAAARAEDDTVGGILGSQGPSWVVLRNPVGRVVGVTTRTELLLHPPGRPARVALQPRRVTVVAHADASVVNGIASWAFEEARRAPADDLVVIVRDDSGAVLGIWHGQDLHEVLEMGPTRSGRDTTLPGDVHIPELLRHCTYAKEGATCGAALWFPEYPAEPPDCPNPQQLKAHRFVW